MSEFTTNDQNCYNEVFARFYDLLMSEKKYTGWKILIEDVVKTHNIPKGICLDIACGTARVTKFPKALGFEVIGVDKSACMLKIAKEKFPGLQFIESDVRSFDIGQDKKAVFALSFYDSLNYLLSDEDMQEMFMSVHRNLADDAIFLFDMNTREHVTASQKNTARVFEEDKFYIVFRFGGEDRTWKLYIDIFEKTPDRTYSKSSEVHVQRGYNVADIRPLLEKSGFELLETREEFKTYEDGNEHLSRLYFIAKKNNVNK